MNHLSEEQLILHYYGELKLDGAERHLAECESCSTEYERLQQLFQAVDSVEVPKRGDDYHAEVWRKVSARLPEKADFDWRSWFSLPRLSLAGSVALLVVIAFFAGRIWQGGPGAEPVPNQVRERILLIAVGDHLESSQRMLIELVNATDGGEVDISAEQARATKLAADNRLYRKTAAHAGDEWIADTLEELERTLLEVANSPTQLTRSDLNDLRRRIEKRGILMKIRIIGDEVRRQETLPPRPSPEEV